MSNTPHEEEIEVYEGDPDYDGAQANADGTQDDSESDE